MNNLEKKLLFNLQNNFPLSVNPYKDIAETMNMSEEQVLNIVKSFKDDKIIRRIGGIINSREIGYYSELCAIKVSDDRITNCALIINESSLVTHNYQRDSEFTLWFTFCEKKELFENSLKELESKIELKIYRFPTKKVFKTKVILDFQSE